MANLTHTVILRPGGSVAEMLEELICPACGHSDPGNALPSISGDRARMFCDCCGTFVTIVFTGAQREPHGHASATD
jgi:hypothetical protein